MSNTKNDILTENTVPAARKSGINWLLWLSSVPLLGIAGAFAVVGQQQRTPVDTVAVVDELTVPNLQSAAPDVYWREERIQQGDSLGSLLSRMGVSDPAALQYLRKQTELSGLKQLKLGRTVQAQTDAEGELLGLQYMDADGVLVKVTAAGDSFSVSKDKVQMTVGTAMKAGTIKSTLFAATDAADLPDDIATSLSDMFGSQINFHKGLHKGDRFKVVYETMSYNGQVVQTGRLLAAEFINGGKVYRAVSFTDASGHTAYYTPEGKSLRKAFLQSPMEFTRVTSGFAMRMHPVLGEWKQHKGVDYGAPTGTKVKVTADGVVTFAGVKNGYGNLIEVKHFGNFTTAYAHLSGFAPNLKVGSKVSQGELIGFVGQTGWATGPHLHYEFRVAGEARDPLSDVVPIAKPMDDKVLPQFTAHASTLTARFDLMQTLQERNLD